MRRVVRRSRLIEGTVEKIVGLFVGQSGSQLEFEFQSVTEAFKVGYPLLYFSLIS